MNKISKIICMVLCGCFILSACSTVPEESSSNAGNDISSNNSVSGDESALQGGSSTLHGTTSNMSTGSNNGTKPSNGTSSSGKLPNGTSSSATLPQGGVVVKPSAKLPDLKVSVSSNAYYKKNFTWDAAGAASKIDYFDSLNLVDSKNAVKLGSNSSLVSDLGISTWVEATGAGGYIQYKVNDLAGVTVEVYSKSAVSMIVKVSADGKNFTDLKTKQMSTANCQGGYKKYVMAISEIPEAGRKYIRIPVAESAYIGRVLLDDHSETFTKAPYDVTFEHTDNIKASGGVYELTNGNTDSLLSKRLAERSICSSI